MFRLVWLLVGITAVVSETRDLTIVKGVAKKGTKLSRDQALTVLNTLDQTNTEDRWNYYKEIKPSKRKKKFMTQFDFKYNPEANDGPIREIQIHTNTIGLPLTKQRRYFQIRNFGTSKWETLGDNANADDWKWQEQTFTITADAADDDLGGYFNSQQKLLIRYRSNKNAKKGVSNLDYLKVVVDVGTSTTQTESPTPLPTAPPTPAPQPTDQPPPPGPVNDWWQPKSSDRLTWQWQIQGTLDTSFNVDMYDVDLFDTTPAQIQALKEDGRIVVCYFSAGTYEGWRNDWKVHFTFVGNDSYSGKAKPFAGNMADWDERWLDIREIDLLAPIMRGRLQLAKDNGCDAVEPDNMDAYTNRVETKIDLTANDQLVYNKWLANEAHSLGLSIGLKNDVDQLEDLVDHFDWALNEECFSYDECQGYVDHFVAQDKAVFGVEYSGSLQSFCPFANGNGLSWLKKRLSLEAWRKGCEDYV